MAAWAAIVTLALAASPGARPVIVIDPGHGGSQAGAEGPSGFREKDLALQVAQRLRAALEKGLSARVFLTRDRDRRLELSDRVRLANGRRPDLFISLHANSMPTRRQRARTEGIETYFLSASASGEDARSTAARENAEQAAPTRSAGGDTLAFILSDLQRSETHEDSSRLAYAVHQQLVRATGAVDRGVQQAPFYVLMGVDAPAILVEVGFISHPEEGRRLKRAVYQERLATAITQGVKSFLEQVKARDRRGEKLARP